MNARQILVNGETFGIHRGKINENFLEIWTVILAPEDVLLKANSTPYTPTNPYHPATKAYADSLETNWQAVFNPQSIAGDVFLRSNHTGDMPAANITQDTSNRFVSDTEKAIWSAKEDPIGAKNTAFNQNYGTIAGTVAAGDHLHNEYEPKNTNIQSHVATVTGNPHAVTTADLSLENVDNTADLDKPISTLTQTALDSKLNTGAQDYRDFTTGIGEPTHQEGRVFYDDMHHSLAYMNDQDMVLNIGQEEIIRIRNNSGARIENKTPITGDGTATNGIPNVIPAIANDFSTANVPAITTHPIEDGEEGFATHAGVLHGDFSAFAIGDRLYLSETVAGGMVTTVADIATYLGGVLDNSTEGAMIVRISSNLALPNVIAYMNGGQLPATIDDTPTTIAGFTSSGNIVLPYDTTAGTITIATGGIYKINATVNFAHDDTGNSTGVASLAVNDGTSDVVIMDFGVQKNQEATNMVMAGISFTAVSGATYSLRISSTTDLDTVVERAVTFSIESFNIR